MMSDVRCQMSQFEKRSKSTLENWRPAGRERARNQKSTKCTITKTLKHEPFEKKSLKLKNKK